MRKNRGLILFIGIIAAIVLEGCSSEPIYYSKKEIKDYVKSVYGNECKLVEEITHKDGGGYGDDEEENPSYEYVFENKDGIEFSVIAYTYHHSIDASTSIFYGKGFSCNYEAAVIEYYKEEIENCSKDYDVTVEITDYSHINVYLNSYEMIDEVAELFVEIDELLSYECDYDNAPFSGGRDSVGYLSVYIKPNVVAEYNDNGEAYQGVAQIVYSKNEENRWKEEDAFEQIQRGFVIDVKEDYQQGRPSFEISDELWYAYPAPSLEVVSINGKAIEEDAEYIYGFSYDWDVENYVICSLDPCQDFENFPYNYTERGKFANLVELLGGKYACKDWKAAWEIGDDMWTAALYTKDADRSSYEFNSFVVYKNKDYVNLSEPSGRGNGTVSGRAFTISDMEEMLGVKFVIDEKEMTIEIVKE